LHVLAKTDICKSRVRVSASQLFLCLFLLTVLFNHVWLCTQNEDKASHPLLHTFAVDSSRIQKNKKHSAAQSSASN